MTILRAILKGQHVNESAIAETGLTLEQLTDFIDRAKKAKFGCMFFGMGLSMTRGKHMNSAALLTLAAELNAFTKFVAMPMRGHGNVTGADVIMRWQTGFPFGITFNRGYPRYNPGEFSTVDVLVRGDTDAALILGLTRARRCPSPRSIISPAFRRLCSTRKSRTPAGSPASTSPRRSQGSAAPGTAYRMDEIPLPLKPALKSPYPTDQEVVRRINEAVARKSHWIPDGGPMTILQR